MPPALQLGAYGQAMSDTRYGHSNVGGGNQDQGERKDDGWKSRQGGDQSRDPGGKGEPEPRDRAGRESGPPRGTNSQGDLAGIGEASDETAREVDRRSERESEPGPADRGSEAAGTDQPPRMGGPLGPNPKDDPHLPEGAQDTENRGTGAGGFDVGVNAKVTGAVHQGARPEEASD